MAKKVIKEKAIEL